MKLATKILVVAGMAAMLVTKPLLAGDGKTFKDKVVVEEARKWWGASLSTGWDSLYMFRGVNVLRFGDSGKQSYGSSLYWTQLNLSFMPTANDTITLGSWMAFGIGRTSYKELDLTANYTHTFGDLALGVGYTFYYYLASELYQNELNATAAYTFHLPWDSITVTPSLTYFFNLGPDYHNFDRGTGAVETASSYLYARVDSNIPLYKDILALAPWIGFGTSFDFNPKVDDSSSSGFEFFTGANNLEMGLGLPIKINNTISLYAYGAYSYQWYGLVGTEPSTFYGGAKVTFSF